MSAPKKEKRTFSLISTLSIIFLIIGSSFVSLSFISINGLIQVKQQFDTLSSKALPLALGNAALTKGVLEQVKLLNYGTQLDSNNELDAIRNKIDEIKTSNQQRIQELLGMASKLSTAVTPQQQQQLVEKIQTLENLTQDILIYQSEILVMKSNIDKQVVGFRYGLSSIGPEMNRISLLFNSDNPIVFDAASRFIASASSMESTFLVLMMQSELEKAKDEHQEMRNRIAGINLAFEDFIEWHPEIEEFTSLTAPYQMVREGFSTDGVLQQILSKLAREEKQKVLLQRASGLANETALLLDNISATADSLIADSQKVVNMTIATNRNILFSSSVLLVSVVLGLFLFLRKWIKRSLKRITKQLAKISEHDLSGNVEVLGPTEIQNIATKLNIVIDSTHDSVAVVTRNCETLYQTAEISHSAAEESRESLKSQNSALDIMVSTVTELEASISEIAQVTQATLQDSQQASHFSRVGLEAVEGNRSRLEMLAATLDSNEQSMSKLDGRVKQIQEMVDLISGIADNTNLLALNAAIEAARAGEMGRGFAVVADEVRKLASDTSEQTTNIRDMMDELIRASENSRIAVAESRQEMVNAMLSGEGVKSSFLDIERAIGMIADRVEQVTVATNQQQRATEEVGKAIVHVSDQGEMTDLQLTSMVESSEQVADIAGHQQAMLHKYQLKTSC
ncbi:methyl-accepting chemotaxis protein [Vibrio sp. ZSDZ34]|uniref:Methyl-accepting chemotaxis protein n=1 Tax=Vibrio gelatinilyticus TaxID=2893468 RepID=A0A9X1W950_9VIBR|nr:methyl-accepting chemotaxis protein [Vibrio gelatinilyticus]MCJ2376652.1 methyl-accepting chemotaxis protein [Vibrio gelatinilyticus]